MKVFPPQQTFVQPEGWAMVLDQHSLVIHRRTEEPRNSRLVVLVHGFSGQAYTTWKSLPKFLFEDFPQVDIGLFSFRSGWRSWMFWKTAPVAAFAKVLAGQLELLLGYQQVLLIGHSLGGVVAASAICELYEGRRSSEKRHVLQSICGLLVIATPLGGAFGSRWLSCVAERALKIDPVYHENVLSSLGKLAIGVSPESGQTYHVPTWSLVATFDRFVKAFSATMGVPAERCHHVAHSHARVVKPADKEHDGYLWIAARLRQAMKVDDGTASVKRSLWDDFCCRAPTSEPEWEETYALACGFFGEGITPLPRLRAMEKKVPGIVQAILLGSERGPKWQIVGYFCYFPLTQQAASELRAKKLAGASIDCEHLCERNERPAALYLGAVAARGRPAQAFALRHLRERILRIVAGEPLELLTRPVTEAGLRTLREHHFEPVEKEANSLNALHRLSHDPG